MTDRIKLVSGEEVKVDADDFDRIAKFRWYRMENHPGRRDSKVYAYRPIKKNGSQRSLLMHREIMRAVKGSQLDHANGDGLDNRKENLRFCTQSQNNANAVHKRKREFRGVAQSREGKEYHAMIKHEGKITYRGGFATAREAAKEYDRLARSIYGEFATTNFGL